MKLSVTFEKFRNHELQVLVLWREVKRKKDLENDSYEDFKADLYINHKYIADISHVLSDVGVFTQMVDDIDWQELYAKQIPEEVYE